MKKNILPVLLFGFSVSFDACSALVTPENLFSRFNLRSIPSSFGQELKAGCASYLEEKFRVFRVEFSANSFVIDNKTNYLSMTINDDGNVEVVDKLKDGTYSSYSIYGVDIAPSGRDLIAVKQVYSETYVPNVVDDEEKEIDFFIDKPRYCVSGASTVAGSFITKSEDILRALPMHKSGAVIRVPEGSKVTLVSNADFNDWRKVRYGMAMGYLPRHSLYLGEPKSANVYISDNQCAQVFSPSFEYKPISLDCHETYDGMDYCDLYYELNIVTGCESTVEVSSQCTADFVYGKVSAREIGWKSYDVMYASASNYVTERHGDVVQYRWDVPNYEKAYSVEVQNFHCEVIYMTD